jgi:hypothetical protein
VTTTIPHAKVRSLLAGSSRSLAEAALASEELDRLKVRLRAAIADVAAVAQEAAEVSELISQNRQNVLDLLRAGRQSVFTAQDRTTTLASLEVMLSTIEQLLAFTSGTSIPLPPLPDLTKIRAFAADHLAELEAGWPWLDAAEEAEDQETAKLAASFPLSNDELRELAAKHPPQQSWYEETGKPF